MTEIDRDYEYRRNELVQLLQSYRDERYNIERLTDLARSEAAADLYPNGMDYSKDRVQTSFDSGALAERTVGRIDNMRKHLAEVLFELENRSNLLDKLLLEIKRLPAYQGRVIIGLYIDGHEESHIAEDMGKSEDTICGYRKAAIRRLTNTVLGSRVRVSRNASPKQPGSSVGSAVH